MNNKLKQSQKPMETSQIKENLKMVFGVVTDEELALHLTKTDLDNRAEMLHATSVVWCYSESYAAKNRGFLWEIIDSESDESQCRLAIDAKHGYGYYDYCQQQNLEVNSKESYAFFGYS